MKKEIVLNLIAFLGAIAGYVEARIGGVDSWLLIPNILAGGFLFWGIGRALYIKYYGAFIGLILGLLFSIISDLAVGSDITVRNKLVYMSLGLMAFWAFKQYWKPLLVGGIIGGCVGFVLGLELQNWFGNVDIQQGAILTLLFVIRFVMIGMSIAQIFIGVYESKKMTKHNAPS